MPDKFEVGDVVRVSHYGVHGVKYRGTANIDKASNTYAHLHMPGNTEDTIKIHNGGPKHGREVGTTPGSIVGGHVVRASGSIKESIDKLY